MTTTATGRQAEQAASEYLVRQGYEILDRNWKTRYCEIDIIARKGATVVFVEVKYRATNGQGGGLDYVTRPKLRRMRFAAEAWLSRQPWRGTISLAAIEVCAPDFEVTGFIESIDVD